MRQVFGLSEDKESITLKRFHGNFEHASHVEMQNEVYGIFLDIETTGMSLQKDKIINLGYILFSFEKSCGLKIKIHKEFNQLQDPKMSLSPKIISLTGFKDEDLVGKSIDWTEVQRDFEKSSLIIAHNASFDRGFVDQCLPLSKDKIWACSMSQIDWREKGHGSSAIEYLAKDHGYFFDGHTALVDAKASLHLLTLQDPDTQKNYLHELLQNARIKMKWVYAAGADFSVKDELKERGYSWERHEKVWRKKVPETSQEEEEFILSHPLAGNAKIKVIPLHDNFKKMT